MALTNSPIQHQQHSRACGCTPTPSRHPHVVHHHTTHPQRQHQRAGHNHSCHALPVQELSHITTSLADVAAVAISSAATELQPVVGQSCLTAVDPGEFTLSPVDPSTYTPGPVQVGWQIWFAAVVSTVPFVIGAYEFGKRIVIQRRCKVCGGTGLVQRGRFQRKCPQCGGFFPWRSWKDFLSANARPGNGGPVLQPRGQTSVFYTVPPAADGGQQHEGVSTSSSSEGVSGGETPSGAPEPAASDQQSAAAVQQEQPSK